MMRLTLSLRGNEGTEAIYGLPRRPVGLLAMTRNVVN